MSKRILIDIDESDWEAILSAAGGDDGLEKTIGPVEFRVIRHLFLFLRDNKYVEETIMDEHGVEHSHYLIYWDRSECPVCSEDLPEDSPVCGFCGFDADKDDDNHEKAISCALIAMAKEAQDG